MTYNQRYGYYQTIGDKIIVGYFSIRGPITAVSSPAYARVQLSGLPWYTGDYQSLCVIREYGGGFVNDPILALKSHQGDTHFISLQGSGTVATQWKTTTNLYCNVGFLFFR